MSGQSARADRMIWRHRVLAGMGSGVSSAALGLSLLAGSPAFGVEFSNGQITSGPAGDAAAAPQPGLPNPHAPAGPPDPAVAGKDGADAAAKSDVSAEEPVQPEDAALQDELDDPTAGEEPAAPQAGLPAAQAPEHASPEQQATEPQATEPQSPERQADAGSTPRQPRHGVPVPQGGELFPTSPIIERQKAFWIHAFTGMTSRQGVLHDGRIIGPTYETVEFDEDVKPREQNASVRRRIQDLSARLYALADKIELGQPLDEEQQRLRDTLPKYETPETIRERVHYIRFQRGLADRFRNGLARSGAILDEVRRLMTEHGVPADLAYLPHVESSFNNATLSRAGAAGIWQFTRGTGRIFLTVQGEVDERLDPVIAARAAAIFLKQNYERLGTWPLAITAYNHGPQSLEKIVAKTGTVDLGKLIEDYNGPLFHFASKNFYSEFLAAREVATHFKDYFGDVELARPRSFTRVELPFYLEFGQAARSLGVSTADLAQLNPSLRPTVLVGAKLIPKGFRLRVPPQFGGQRFLAVIPDSARAKEQKVLSEVRVARGDTLFSIGRRNNIPWTAIAAANNLGPRSRLQIGQRLILPRPGQPVPMSPAIAAAQTGRAPQPAAQAPAQPVAQQSASAAPGRADAAVKTISLDGMPMQGTAVSAAPSTAPAAATGPAAGTSGTASPSNEPSSPAVVASSLALHDVDAARHEGVVRSVFGETIGHYADWAQIPALEIRERNGMGPSGTLRPGRRIVIPLHVASADSFNAQRLAYHRAREQAFFASYTVRDKVEVRLAHGQSIWSVAQEYNVPMWLLYRENPDLLNRPVQLGMRVIVPRVEETAATPR